MKSFLFIFLLTALLGCGTSSKKTILDTSSSKKPSWVDSSDLSWEEKGKYFFKGDYTIQGDERINACIDLAKINVKESLITEIQEELKGAISSATESIKNNAEIILTKSYSSNYMGSITGLKFRGKYWEKYVLSNEEEKISCHILARVNKKDYLKTKRGIINKMTSASPELKRAIQKKQIDFFQNET